MVIRNPNPRFPTVNCDRTKSKNGIEFKKGPEPVDHWEFLDEIEAPMWVDLTVECMSTTYADKDDEWFHTSHPFHQSSSKAMKAAFSRIQQEFSPYLPASVSRSRGKDYRSREWGKGNNQKISLDKKHPVKNLNSKSSRANSGFTKAMKDGTSHTKVKHSGASNSSNSESTITYEDIDQNHKKISNSTCAITELQSQKCTEISSQVIGQTSDFLSSLRVSIRKSCVTQALRVVVDSRRQSEGQKSASSKSSIGSSNVHKEDRSQSMSQRKDTTPDSRNVFRTYHPPKEKMKQLSMSKGHHRTHTTQQKALVPNRGNGVMPSNKIRKDKERTETKCKRTMAAGKENAPGIIAVSQKSSFRERAATVKVQVPKALKESVPGTTLTGRKVKVDDRREMRNPRKIAEKVFLR